MTNDNKRVESARTAVADAMVEYGPDGHIDGYEEITHAALAAADAVMFSDEALERAAWSIFSADGGSPSRRAFDLGGPFVDECYKNARAVIAALKGGQE